jgi:hypothetical protein
MSPLNMAPLNMSPLNHLSTCHFVNMSPFNMSPVTSQHVTPLPPNMSPLNLLPLTSQHCRPVTSHMSPRHVRPPGVHATSQPAPAPNHLPHPDAARAVWRCRCSPASGRPGDARPPPRPRAAHSLPGQCVRPRPPQLPVRPRLHRWGHASTTPPPVGGATPPPLGPHLQGTAARRPATPAWQCIPTPSGRGALRRWH